MLKHVGRTSKGVMREALQGQLGLQQRINHTEQKPLKSPHSSIKAVKAKPNGNQSAKTVKLSAINSNRDYN